MSDTFYRAFEDRYRGAREVIKARLAAYLPFITPLTSPDNPARALDLGCGRGEWLELLGENHFLASGIDLDDNMLAACRERALQVERTDALTGLRAVASNSLALVSAFHLVEHMPFDQVQELVKEALRVLQPGGLLIMETPNSENLVVGASSFYMDPSHLRPVPAALLGFVTDHSGYARHKVVRLQEPRQLHTDAPIGLIDVLDGVSPDYAIVAQKTAAPEILAACDTPFQASYGFALGDLAVRYEQQTERRHAKLHNDLRQLEARANERLHAIEQRLIQAESRATQYSQQIIDLHSSSSWRVTAPLRKAAGYARSLRAAVRRIRFRFAFKVQIKRTLLQLARSILRRPRLARAAQSLLRYFPALRTRLRGLVHTNVMPQGSAAEAGDLSPRTARMVDELKQSLKAKKH